jgi:hypothetical protein
VPPVAVVGGDGYRRSVTNPSELQLRGAEWVRRVTPEQLGQRMGELTLARAELYVDSERVQSINTGDRGRLLLATVEGNRARPYTVMITRMEDFDGAPEWHSRCSCPMATECKHVAATLLVANATHLAEAAVTSQPPRRDAGPPEPEWKQSLANWAQRGPHRGIAFVQLHDRLAQGPGVAAARGDIPHGGDGVGLSQVEAAADPVESDLVPGGLFGPALGLGAV